VGSIDEVASHFAFVEIVAADRDLVVTRADDHVCRLEPRAPGALAWHCVLSDGTSNDSERDPASYVSWVCPALRLARPGMSSGIPPVEVSRAGPQSDLGKLLKGLGRLGRARTATPEGASGPRYVYTDPAGVLDAGLRRRIERWPPAMHGDGVTRPVELSSIRRTGEGLIVSSTSWWGSAPALDHQIALALDLAARLAAHR
jgi:hypothetical protein